jgi:hypothetical protein
MEVQEFHVWDCDIRDVQRLVGIWLYVRVIMGLSVKRASNNEGVKYWSSVWKLGKGTKMDEGLYGDAPAFTMSRGDGLRGCTSLESARGYRSLSPNTLDDPSAAAWRR